MTDKRERLQAARYYRLAFRDIASGTNERTLVFCLLPPCLLGNTAPCEQTPGRRRTIDALLLLGLANSFVADWTVRVRAASHVNLFILNAVRLAASGAISTFVVHNSGRLTCNHAGYAPLWREQLNEAWREAGTPFTWPVLSGDDARWAVRTAIDAVVADAYGLTRDQYAHVLSTFSHSSYKDAPRQCLVAFDELQQIGLEAFTRKYDPYWDIPLNQNLPQPVIDLPIPSGGPGETPHPRPAELFDFPISAAPVGSAATLAGHSAKRQTRIHKKH
jgi:hypothetical protein